MLKPAILFKEELSSKFKQYYYTVEVDRVLKEIC